jgi:hypothetical protein
VSETWINFDQLSIELKLVDGGADLIYPLIEFTEVRGNRVFDDWINVPRRIAILEVQENIVMVFLEFSGIVIGGQSLQRSLQVCYDNGTACVPDIGLISKARSKLIDSRLRIEYMIATAVQVL